MLSDFPGIRNLSGLNNLNRLNNLGGLHDLNSLISSKKLPSLIFPSTLAPKLLILVWKLPIFLIFDILSLGGCGGQGCYF